MRPARSAERAAAVINYMSVRPQRAFTLTELSTALRINATSLTDVLLALTQTGYLLRHETRKTYELGPALVAVGYAASTRHPVVERARPVMEELAALGAECVGTARAGKDMINLAVAAARGAVVHEWRIGQRVPILRPYGQLYTSWTSLEALGQWLSPDEMRLERHPEWQEHARVNRQRGYVVTLDGPDAAPIQRQIEDAQMSPSGVDTNTRLRELVPTLDMHAHSLGEIRDDATYEINYIGAPIFDRFGGAVYSLSVFGFGTVSGREVRRVGESVRDRCRSITREIGGHAPELDEARS